MYQARKRARESEHETIERRANERQCITKKKKSMTEQEHVEHKATKRLIIRLEREPERVSLRLFSVE